MKHSDKKRIISLRFEKQLPRERVISLRFRSNEEEYRMLKGLAMSFPDGISGLIRQAVLDFLKKNKKFSQVS